MTDKLSLTKTIGPVSAKVLFTLIENGKDIFTLDDACKIYAGGRQETSNFLRDLVYRGVLARIKSGVFMILKMGQENTQLTNWPIIAHILSGTNNYYISYYAAMRLHGMTTHALTTITITMSKKHIAKKVNNIYYQFVYSKPEHFWGACEHWVTKQEKVHVSDLERTILDGLERPDLCGGVIEVVRGIWSKQKQIDWSKLAEYARKYHTKAAVKRLGFILEMLNFADNSLPLLANTIVDRKDYILLDPNGSKVGKYVSRWRVQLNVNIDELKASVWG